MSVVITACHTVIFQAGLWGLEGDDNEMPFGLNAIIKL